MQADVFLYVSGSSEPGVWVATFRNGRRGGPVKPATTVEYEAGGAVPDAYRDKPVQFGVGTAEKAVSLFSQPFMIRP